MNSMIRHLYVGIFNQLNVKQERLTCRVDTKHLLTLELRRATSQSFLHTCLPFEIQILQVKLCFVSNWLVYIVSNLSLIKASNLLGAFTAHVNISTTYLKDKFDYKIALLQYPRCLFS